MQRSLVFLLVLVLCPFFLFQPAVHAKTTQPSVIVQKKEKSSSEKSIRKGATPPPSSRVTPAAPKKAVPKPVPRKPTVTQTTKQTQTDKKKKAGPPVATTRSTVSKKNAGKPAVVRKQQASPRSRAPKTGTRPLPVQTSPRQDVGMPAEGVGGISARSAMVMDAGTGEAIFAKMPDNPRQPASTIKIVTAMIALQSLKNEESVEVSRHAADMPSSKIFLKTGATYRADDLINAVLLESANDASVALGEKIAGSEEQFANLMTISAKMWGARNTICRTASGLTADGQQSTARDLANLFRFAMQHAAFADRMKEKFIRTSYGKNLRNHNKALWRIDGAVGGKTGYTVAARQTYVGQFSRDGRSIVVAIMGSESMWADLGKLVEYGFKKKL